LREAVWYKGSLKMFLDVLASLKLASLVFRLPLAFAKAANIPFHTVQHVPHTIKAGSKQNPTNIMSPLL